MVHRYEERIAMAEFLTAVLVTVAAALLERLAVRVARQLWEAMRPATG
jgi:hypothetical protein